MHKQSQQEIYYIAIKCIKIHCKHFISTCISECTTTQDERSGISNPV